MTDRPPQRESRLFGWFFPRTDEPDRRRRYHRIIFIVGLSLFAWLIYPFAAPPLRKLFEQPESTSFGDLLGWPPIFWTARVLIFILLVGGGSILVLLMARFFRPDSIRRMLSARLPEFREVGGSAEILGQKFEATGKLVEAVELAKDADRIRDQQVEGLATRLTELENGHQSLVRAMRVLVEGEDPENGED